MEELKGDTNFRFLFAGGGPLRKQFEQSCKRAQITAAEFRPYSPKANLGESLGAGDIGLVTQRSNCAGSVVPSKIYGLLAAGRPIPYIGRATRPLPSSSGDMTAAGKSIVTTPRLSSLCFARLQAIAPR